MSKRALSVSVFCGGRGSSSILRELLRRPDIELNLLINAYDDGLSTGALRRLIPGMLGPSDFRKNLSHLLELHSRTQFDLAKILEHRLDADFASIDLDNLIATLGKKSARRRSSPTIDLFRDLEASLIEKLRGYLATFRAYCERAQAPFSFADCALGNLLFVGAYLENGHSFNAAVRDMTIAMGCNANLINITRGENRILVGLKADGELLDCEAKIVGPQSAQRIAGIYLLKEPIAPDAWAALVRGSFEEKRVRLAALEAPTDLSIEAREAVLGADILVYGPGTQFSSLFPSYKTGGLREAIESSPAKLKAFVVNLRADHDIQALAPREIVDEALRYLSDPDNDRNSISHVLAHGNAETGVHHGAAWIEDGFENERCPGIHNGHKTVSALLSLYRRSDGKPRKTLDVYVDLRDRAPAANLVVQEFSELDWGQDFSEVRLTINGAELHGVTLPPPLELRATERTEPFSEVDVFKDWLLHGSSDYLVTLAGDGEYRLGDILVAASVLKTAPFGAVFGSRNQNRTQMQSSLVYAYGEDRTLYWGSFLGAYVFSGVCALRFQFMLSDPFTGFRVYRRRALEGLVLTEAATLESGSDVAKLLLGSGIEIAEIPIHYRTFKGFTNVKTRLRRGLKNAVGILT